MGKINVVDMMNMPLRVRIHILTTLGSGEANAWEYNPSDHILIMDLHKLLVPVGYDNEEQMSSILAHIHLKVVDHVIIHSYVDFCTRDGYNGHSMTLYHPIDIRCFLELNDLVHNPPQEMFFTYRLHGNINNNNE
jgi:hypothetical protein